MTNSIQRCSSKQKVNDYTTLRWIVCKDKQERGNWAMKCCEGKPQQVKATHNLATESSLVLRVWRHKTQTDSMHPPVKTDIKSDIWSMNNCCYSIQFMPLAVLESDDDRAIGLSTLTACWGQFRLLLLVTLSCCTIAEKTAQPRTTPKCTARLS